MVRVVNALDVVYVVFLLSRTFNYSYEMYRSKADNSNQVCGGVCGCVCVGGCAMFSIKVFIAPFLSLRCSLSFIDFEGKSDGESIKRILTIVKPRQLVSRTSQTKCSNP